MSAVADRRAKEGISDRTDRALGSAAGALSFAEGADDVFEMSDADVGRLIKQKARARKRVMPDLREKGTRGHPLTEPVSVELPVESSAREHAKARKEDFPAGG